MLRPGAQRRAVFVCNEIATRERTSTFDRLTAAQFEELTYDLLRSLDYSNLDWRKGTGRDAFSADQGRDIIGDLRRTDLDGSPIDEHWFVQCKHYSRGVPAGELGSALAWAAAEVTQWG